jgi:hypothetical protein
MLIGYFDDSGTEPPINVLAGFIASESDWRAFSIEWMAALRETPSIPYLKTKDALSGNGVFAGWRQEDIVKKIRILKRIIEKHARFHVISTIEDGASKEVYGGKVSVTLETSFLSLAAVAMGQTILYVHELNVAGKYPNNNSVLERISFVFDNRPIGDRKEVEDYWTITSEYENPISIGLVNRYYGNPPVFKDDVDCPPLQAADMLAWFIRRDAEEQSKKVMKFARKSLLLFGSDFRTSGVIKHITKQEMIERRDWMISMAPNRPFEDKKARAARRKEVRKMNSDKP